LEDPVATSANGPSLRAPQAERPLCATSGRSWKLCVDQLPGNANAVACLADATLQHVENVKLAANPFDVDSLAFLGKP
jgi:hypothetical protein